MSFMDFAAQVIAELAISAKQLAAEDANEAKTRLEIIDRVLKDVLGWPIDTLNPEEYIPGDGEREWIDYHLQDTSLGVMIVVEAKRIGKSFHLGKVKRNRVVTLQSLRSAHGSDLGAAIKQAINYCQSIGTYAFLVTNGLQWVASIAFWPNVKPSDFQAVVFHDIDDIAANLSEFVDLLSPGGMSRHLLLDRAVKNQSFTPVFAKSVNLSATYNPPVDKNYLKNELNLLMMRCFDGMNEDYQRDLLEKCYVTNELVESYIARLEVFVGHDLPIALKGASKIDRARFERETGADPFSKVLKARGEPIFLVGPVGSGKSTFVRYALANLRRKYAAGQWIVLFVDLLNKTQLRFKTFDHDALRRELANDLLTQIAKEYAPDFDPFDFEQLKGIFSGEVQRLLGSMPKELRDNPEFARLEIYNKLKSLQDDPFLHLTRTVEYLKKNREVFVTIIIDNIDRASRDFEELAVIFSRRISQDTGATTVTALRETTYLDGDNRGFLDVSQNAVFTISPPPFLSVVSRRIDYMRANLRENSALMRKVRSGMGEYPIERVSDFLDVLSEIILKVNHEISEAIQALAGTNVRRALSLLREFVTSGNTNIEQLLKEYNGGWYRQPLAIFLRSIMRGDHSRYDGGSSKILNLFIGNARVLQSHFDLIRIARYLVAEAENNGSRKDASVGQVIAAFVSFPGYRSGVVVDCLHRLGEYGLVYSRSHPEADLKTVGPEALVRVSSGGYYYLRTLLYNREYLESVVDDSIIYDVEVHARMMEIHHFPDRSWAWKSEEKLKIFLAYLWEREESEIQKLGPGPSIPAWFGSISLDIATRVFGDNFAKALMSSTGGGRRSRNKRT